MDSVLHLPRADWPLYSSPGGERGSRLCERIPVCGNLWHAGRENDKKGLTNTISSVVYNTTDTKVKDFVGLITLGKYCKYASEKANLQTI